MIENREANRESRRESKRDVDREAFTGRLGDFRNGVCIHTDQVYDSCRERD